MLEKPAIADEKITACLLDEFGLRITQMDFLPLGANLCSAVYRAVADNGTAYFCKLRCSDFDEISVELPKFLREQGITHIISPLVTRSGRLWAVLEAFNLILYPFIEGRSGFDVQLSERQWAVFGSELRRIHQVSAPPAISHKIQKENYSPESRDICRSVIQRLDSETFDDPITRGMADFLLPRRATILDLLGHAERLARDLAERDLQPVICHSDIHPGNLFLTMDGDLYIVDWDATVLAPKERDLIFIGGGQGYVGISDQEEERFFYRSYGDSPVDPYAMAFYRCERNLYDLSVETMRIFSDTLNDKDRAQSLQIITWLFLPGASVDMAYKSLRVIP